MAKVDAQKRLDQREAKLKAQLENIATRKQIAKLKASLKKT